MQLTWAFIFYVCLLLINGRFFIIQVDLCLVYFMIVLYNQRFENKLYLKLKLIKSEKTPRLTRVRGVEMMCLKIIKCKNDLH